MSAEAATSDAAPQDPHVGEVIEWFGLQSTAEELRWLLPVTYDVAGATGTLHGGCALAAAVAALESVTGRPMAAASAQYLARLPVGGCAAVALDIGASGNRMTQASAEITDAADGRVILRALVSLGGRQLGIDQTWTTAPDVPPPSAQASGPRSSPITSSLPAATRPVRPPECTECGRRDARTRDPPVGGVAGAVYRRRVAGAASTGRCSSAPGLHPRPGRAPGSRRSFPRSARGPDLSR